jgi:hypothetical protein
VRCRQQSAPQPAQISQYLGKTDDITNCQRTNRSCFSSPVSQSLNNISLDHKSLDTLRILFRGFIAFTNFDDLLCLRLITTHELVVSVCDYATTQTGFPDLGSTCLHYVMPSPIGDPQIFHGGNRFESPGARQ